MHFWRVCELLLLLLACLAKCRSKTHSGCFQDQGSNELSCLLTASHDQKVAIWTMDGDALGSLRQGDRVRSVFVGLRSS